MRSTTQNIIINGIFYEYLDGFNKVGIEISETALEREYTEVSNYIRNTINLIDNPTSEDVEIIARGYWLTFFDNNVNSTLITA